MLSLIEWLVFAATGRVLIYVWFQFPLPPAFSLKQTYFHKTISKLHSCDLCAGVWIYSLLALATGADMFGMDNLISYVATGAITSLVVHIFAIGWKEKFVPPQII